MVRQWRLALWHFATLAHLSTRLPHALKRLLTSTLLPTRFRGTTASKNNPQKRLSLCHRGQKHCCHVTYQSKFSSFFHFQNYYLLCPSIPPNHHQQSLNSLNLFLSHVGMNIPKKALHCTLTSRSETRKKGVWCPLAGVPLVESGTNTEYAFVLRCLRA